MTMRSTLLIVGLICLASVSPRSTAAQSTAAAPDPSIDGEDIGAEQGRRSSNALKQVQQRMKDAESMLAARDASGKVSATQQEVVDELDAMIAQLQEQCEKCGGQCNKPTRPSNKPAKPSAKKGGKPEEAAGVAKTQAGGPVDRKAVSNLVKDIWGRLPERQREELLQPLSEEFLPKYATEIEEYFRVLAEPPAEAMAPESQR
jgi:gas vesicle protein